MPNRLTPQQQAKLESHINTLNQVLELMTPIIQSDNRSDIVWLSHTRHIYGYTRDAISRLIEDINEGKEKKFMVLGEDKD